ncbi:MAG: 50S ribosomal protein L24e [Candidatus Micrarchaeota archaeon]
MAICSFCGNEIGVGTGFTIFKRNGSATHFCSRKCQKNQMKLGRNPAHLKWTQKFASTAKKKKK